MVGVDHAPTTAVFATDAYTLPPSSPGPPISSSSVPVVSGSMPVQLGSESQAASDRGIETLPTVSDHAMLTIVVSLLIRSVI